MNQSHSDRIKDLFAVRSHDIIPVSVRYAAHVLYFSAHVIEGTESCTAMVIRNRLI